MADLLDRIERAAARIDPRWSDEEITRGWERLQRRQRRQKVARAGIALSVACAGLLLARALLMPAARDRGGQWLADGSRITALDTGTELTLVEDSGRATLINLERGRGRFEVTPRTHRPFLVRAGEVTITVVGTVFTVERIADRVGVVVERGQVLVSWPSEERRLAAGQSQWFPPISASSRASNVSPTLVPLAPAAPPRVRLPSKGSRRIPAVASSHPSAVASSRAVVASSRAVAAATTPATGAPASASGAQAGWDSAAGPALVGPTALASGASSARPPSGPGQVVPSARPPEEPSAPLHSDRSPPPLPLSPPPPSAVPSRPSPQQLLDSADEARLQGRSSQAVEPLRRLLRENPDDPRAALAAFTLGRLLLGELGRPREAAEAFALARDRDPRGPFSEDALAREVEAWARAGDRDRARQRAQEFLHLFPEGVRTRAVRSFGGLE